MYIYQIYQMHICTVKLVFYSEFCAQKIEIVHPKKLKFWAQKLKLYAQKMQILPWKTTINMIKL